MDEMVSQSLARQNFNTLLLTLFAAIALLLAAVGVAAGLAAAFGLTRFLASLLYGVKAADPMTFAGVALAIVPVALAASYIPALRAAAVDPNQALRHE
jgi:putative ABC transport system permease protein